MRKTMVVALLLGGLLLPAAGANAAGMKPAQRLVSCRYQSANPYYSWSRWEVRQTIRCAATKWPVPLSTAMTIAERESHFTAWVHNTSSRACGIYQWLPSWWDALPRMARLNGKDGARQCTNARTNVLAAIKFAHYNGWGPWS